MKPRCTNFLFGFSSRMKQIGQMRGIYNTDLRSQSRRVRLLLMTSRFFVLANLHRIVDQERSDIRDWRTNQVTVGDRVAVIAASILRVNGVSLKPWLDSLIDPLTCWLSLLCMSTIIGF